MRIKVTLKGTAPYSQSRQFTTEKQEGESDAHREQRCWKERAHTNSKGQVVLPMFGLKAALDSAAKYLSMKLSGNATFAKLFRCAVIPISDQPLLLVDGKPVTVDMIESETINAHADGNRNGSGKRVSRIYPQFRNWSCENVEFEIIDSRITKEIFLKHLAACGQFIGIGRFRPDCGGFNGRFEVFCDNKSVSTDQLTVREDLIADDEATTPVKRNKRAAKTVEA